MNLNLHRNARTTPAIRQELRESTKSDRELAREYHLNRATVRNWRRRENGQDASHRPHRLHATLSPVQEQVVVALRQPLLLPLDDLLAITREFIHPEVSRSGLDRCLRRHGVSNLSALIPQRSNRPRPSRTTRQGSSTLMSKTCRRGPRRRRISLCSSRSIAPRAGSTSKSYPRKPPPTPATSCSASSRKSPFTLEKILTDNGKEFTDRFCATGEREPTGRHRFDQGCARHGIEHRLIAPRHPQTNGMVERFNGRIADVLATTRFDSAQNLADTLTGYVRLYNHQIPQKALGHIAPIQALKSWQQKCPERFKKRVYNLTGLDR